ncbi:MAG: hypothetical protein IH594_15655 [Bacteroidales bacterium]|nr:hypothetical protein [Bacteroidales bacterium]
MVLLSFQEIRAQDKTQYLLHEIPQNISLNPAITYTCKNYIELPLISQLQFSYRNNAFTHRQIFNSGQGITGDSVKVDINRLSEVLGNRNHIRLAGRINLLGFGFAWQDWFFSFNASNRSAMRLSFNRDILDARDGNWNISANEPREININGTGLHLLNYTEFAFGAGYELYPGFSFGMRAKYLMGSAHLQTRRSDIRLETNSSPIQLTGYSDLLVRGSLPVTLGVDSDGYLNSFESGIESVYDLPALLLSWNHGFALDAGVIYEFSSQLTGSASILDLGFIRWRKNINVISQEEVFAFDGVDLNEYLSGGTETDFLQAMEDSISAKLFLEASENPYNAMLPARFLAGLEYKWKPKVSLGAVMEGEILSGRFYPSLSLTAIARPIEWLTASLSYSIMDRWFSNFGFGIAAGNGPVQFYIVSDNIPLRYVKETETGIIWPYHARTFNFRTGLNIIIGCPEKQDTRRKAMKWKKSCPTYN